MHAYDAFLNAIINRVEGEHTHHGSPLAWVNPYAAAERQLERDQLLERLAPTLQWDFKNTKPWINSLSPGCRICGEGAWSCLFITGICNAGCFYCPARQDQDETPQSQRLLFDEPEAYADYITEFGFRGVAFSGGEPLLVPDRTEAYIRAVRKSCNPDIYMWMYTNGILASETLFKRFADAGIDEMRFDLGAVAYNPAVLKEAVKYIPRVTVEIPAVPEELETIVRILPTLEEYGVSGLNLHQLRLSLHNAPKLLERTYTYLHGEAPTVLESELTALKIMEFVKQSGLSMVVNYCNFQFKNRFQKAGFRRIMATRLKREGETITENGFLRALSTLVDGIEAPWEITSTETPEQVTLSYRGRVIENLSPMEGAAYHPIGSRNYPVKEGLNGAPRTLNATSLLALRQMLAEGGAVVPEEPEL